MVRPPGTPNGDERKMPKGRGQETTARTAKPMHMLRTAYHKKSKRDQADVESIMDQ